MQACTIRPITKQDDLGIYRQLFSRSEICVSTGKETGDLRIQAIGEEYINSVLSSDLSSYASLNTEFRRGCGEFWVLVGGDSESIIGSVALEDKGAGTGELRRMVVDSRHRRRGLAVALTKHLLDHARRCGLQKVVLSTPSINTGATLMYKKSGFRLERTEEVSTGAHGHLSITHMLIELF